MLTQVIASENLNGVVTMTSDEWLKYFVQTLIVRVFIVGQGNDLDHEKFQDRIKKSESVNSWCIGG